MEISQRLQAVAQFVTGPVVADIGTDHGYIPIYLVQTGKAKKVIAADVRPGPLARAREHIAQYGLNASIETRLGSGLSVLSPGEVQTVVVSGLGGMLLCSLLEEGAAVVASVKQLVLQPQLDVPAVRDAVHRCGAAGGLQGPDLGGLWRRVGGRLPAQAQPGAGAFGVLLRVSMSFS